MRLLSLACACGMYCAHHTICARHILWPSPGKAAQFCFHFSFVEMNAMSLSATEDRNPEHLRGHMLRCQCSKHCDMPEAYVLAQKLCCLTGL